MNPLFLAPKPAPAPRKPAHLAPMPARKRRDELHPHPPTLTWRSTTYLTDYLILEN